MLKINAKKFQKTIVLNKMRFPYYFKRSFFVKESSSVEVFLIYNLLPITIQK